MEYRLLPSAHNLSLFSLIYNEVENYLNLSFLLSAHACFVRNVCQISRGWWWYYKQK